MHDLNASKDKFFSIISHDLRSPFHALLGYTQLLSEHFRSYTEDEALAQINKILTSAKRLYALLENLLTWSRVQRGAMEFEPEDFDIQDIIEYNLDLFMSSAEHKQIALNNTIQREFMVHADYNMLNTVVRNLLSNALKFTPTGGAITLAAKNGGQWLEVAVSDTGTGIKSEDLAKLFRIDVQYTNVGTDGEKGTGLGLILCQDLVQRNGGTIRVESEVGAGTTFKFTVPKQN